MTCVRYQDEILDAFVRPYVGPVGQDFVLMEDNARQHRACVLNEYQEHKGIDRMNWPAHSHDINPIEHVCDIFRDGLVRDFSNYRVKRTLYERSLRNGLDSLVLL